MEIRDATGLSFTDAKQIVIAEIMERYNVDRKDALKLFAEAIVRSCVLKELYDEMDFLLGKEAEIYDTV